MKRFSSLSNVFMLAGTIVVLACTAALAAPPPPPPPPVPTGDWFTQLASGSGIAAYGAYRLWKAKSAAKKNGNSS
jgi:hypothetical protein